MEEKKLRIAIANTPEETPNYQAALKALGADYVCITELDPAGFDGLLLPGGADIDPAFYGQENTDSRGIKRDLDEMQFECLRRFIAAGKPVLGICRGIQVLNVYYGGSLLQDVPNAWRHRQHNKVDSVHLCRAEAGSVLAGLYGTEFPVNSSHHQAADRIGAGLRVTMVSDDGLVEALEHESLPVLGVQWHPERMCFQHRREDTVDGSVLLGYFLQLCRKTEK